MRNRILAALLLLVIISVAGWTQTKPARSQWEYKTAEFAMNSSIEQKLDELGAQGWELVSTQARSFSGGTGNQIIYHFKRLK